MYLKTVGQNSTDTPSTLPVLGIVQYLTHFVSELTTGSPVITFGEL